MRSTVLAVLVAVVAATVMTAAGQPALEGIWMATRETPADLGLAPSAVMGDRLGLAVAGDTVTLTRPVRGQSLVTPVPLTGAEARVVVPGRQCFGDTIQVVTATRTSAGFDYAVVSTTPPGGQTIAGGPTYRFRLEGDVLVIESTIRDAGGSRQVGTVYRRTTEGLPPAMTGPNVTVAPATIADLSWLQGDWAGMVGANAVEERWMTAAGGAMIGTSRTTRGATMVEFEYLCIAQRHGGLVYTAMPNGSGTTDFLATRVSAAGVTFENPDHDFPKAIAYTRRADGGVDVTISGAPGQRSLTYSFSKRD